MRPTGRLLLAAMAGAALAAACGSGGSGGDPLASDADGDSDGDSDADTDADADADADSDTDGDADSDTDADTDGDSDSDADSDGDSDGDSDTDADSDPPCVDEDSDWWCVPFDCDDADPDVNPGEPETPGNEVDDDCNGLTDESGGDGDADADADADSDADADTDTQCIDDCTEGAPVCQPAMSSEYAQGLCDQLDNDCDGQVDEGCTCGVGQVQPCFKGPPNFRDVGQCTDGTQPCVASGEFGVWGACTGGIWPTPEICDNVDNDCDGCTDDDLCCEPPINCDYDVGDAEPFVDKVIDGTQIYTGGDALAWEWTLTKGPCDIVLGTNSFTMNGQAVSTVSGAAVSQLTVRWQLSGAYTLTMRVNTPLNGWLECQWVIHVVAPGLRVELCWDTTGNNDVDLHLGRIGTTTDWFTNSECYYMNCKNSGSPAWGYPQTYSAMPPLGNYQWVYNPRLDIDNISTVGVPENINIDNPGEGHQYRVLVHMYDADGYSQTHPVVNIYCGGTPKATYGVTPQVTGFDYGCYDDCGDGWKVTDVTWHGDPLSDTCTLAPIWNNGYVIQQGPYSWP